MTLVGCEPTISARGDLYLTTHNTQKYIYAPGGMGTHDLSTRRPLPDNTQHSKQIFMPLVGFEPTISARGDLYLTTHNTQNKYLCS